MIKQVLFIICWLLVVYASPVQRIYDYEEGYPLFDSSYSPVYSSPDDDVLFDASHV